MYININLNERVGVQAFAIHNEEMVVSYMLFPEGTKTSWTKMMDNSTRVSVHKKSQVVTKLSFANAYIAEERKVTKPFAGSQVLYINSAASSKSTDLTKQYLFISNKFVTEEEIQKELKNQFFTKALKKLPLPIHDDWKEHFWSKVSCYVSEVEMVGALPYSRIYVLEIPDINLFSPLVEVSHKSHEFKKFFKRVPQLDSVLSVSDVSGFDFKDFQKFLKEMGGKDSIEKLEKEKQIGLLRAYEVLKTDNLELIKENIDKWYTTSIKDIGVILRNTQDKNEKAKVRSSFKKGWDMFKDEYEYSNAFIGNFEKIYKEKYEALKNGDKKAIQKLLNEMSYSKIEPGAEEIALACSKAKVSEAHYREYEVQYLSTVDNGYTSAKEYPTISGSFGKDYEWEIIDMTKGRAWVVGLETNCCQHLHSCGGVCVEYAAKNPSTSGMLRITKKGKTVAQSFFWLSNFNSDGTRTFVFDNIETLRAEVDNSILSIYKDVANELEKFKNLFRISAITIGTGYSDVSFGDMELLKHDNSKFAQVPRTLTYSDAKESQILFAEFKPKFKKEA